MNPKNILAERITLWVVELHVSNLRRMREFYEKALGLNVLKEITDEVLLGQAGKPLLSLHNASDLPKSHGAHAGLYHFALVFKTRSALAKTLKQMLQVAPESYSGSGDHLVSEAFYFVDPEGNGIELYFDRDPAGWQWENNSINMAALYIDMADYLNRYLALEDDESEVDMGHVHLKVGNIEEAKRFYADILGFDVTAELPGALFVSVSGYHHHIGLNSWESAGAGERPLSLGLKSFTFILPNREDLDLLKNRLKVAGISFDESSDKISFHDPWKNKILVRI